MDKLKELLEDLHKYFDSASPSADRVYFRRRLREEMNNLNGSSTPVESGKSS